MPAKHHLWSSAWRSAAAVLRGRKLQIFWATRDSRDQPPVMVSCRESMDSAWFCIPLSVLRVQFRCPYPYYPYPCPLFQTWDLQYLVIYPSVGRHLESRLTQDQSKSSRSSQWLSHLPGVTNLRWLRRRKCWEKLVLSLVHQSTSAPELIFLLDWCGNPENPAVQHDVRLVWLQPSKSRCSKRLWNHVESCQASENITSISWLIAGWVIPLFYLLFPNLFFLSTSSWNLWHLMTVQSFETCPLPRMFLRSYGAIRCPMVEFGEDWLYFRPVPPVSK